MNTYIPLISDDKLRALQEAYRVLDGERLNTRRLNETAGGKGWNSGRPNSQTEVAFATTAYDLATHALLHGYQTRYLSEATDEYAFPFVYIDQRDLVRRRLNAQDSASQAAHHERLFQVRGRLLKAQRGFIEAGGASLEPVTDERLQEYNLAANRAQDAYQSHRNLRGAMIDYVTWATGKGIENDAILEGWDRMGMVSDERLAQFKAEAVQAAALSAAARRLRRAQDALMGLLENNTDGVPHESIAAVVRERVTTEELARAYVDSADWQRRAILDAEALRGAEVLYIAMKLYGHWQNTMSQAATKKRLQRALDVLSWMAETEPRFQWGGGTTTRQLTMDTVDLTSFHDKERRWGPLGQPEGVMSVRFAVPCSLAKALDLDTYWKALDLPQVGRNSDTHLWVVSPDTNYAKATVHPVQGIYEVEAEYHLRERKEQRNPYMDIAEADRVPSIIRLWLFRTLTRMHMAMGKPVNQAIVESLVEVYIMEGELDVAKEAGTTPNA